MITVEMQAHFKAPSPKVETESWAICQEIQRMSTFQHQVPIGVFELSGHFVLIITFVL